MEQECKICLKKSFDRLFENYPMDKSIRKRLSNKLILYISKVNSNISTPEVARTLHEIYTEVVHDPDPYKEEKRKSNNIVLSQYDDFKKMLIASKNPFDTALRLSIAGNIIDFAACPEFFQDASNYLLKTVNKVLNSKFAIDDSLELKRRIEKANTILMLGDNCGEIVLDKLFIETINHDNIHYAARGDPVINDATIEDAYYVGINSYANVISNGYNAPSTILEKSSKEFNDIFNKADLIISKGQGNYEGLIDNHNKNIFFLIMVKCDVIARKTGVKKGDFVVFKNLNENYD